MKDADMIDGTDTNEVRHIPADLAQCLRILRALRLPDSLSPAEKRELEEAATIIEVSYQAARELVRRIEKCGASPELTHAVTLASDLASAIGNRWNYRDRYALLRVQEQLRRDGDKNDG